MYPYENSNSRKKPIVCCRIFWEYMFSHSDHSNVQDVLKLLFDFLYNDYIEYETIADLIPEGYSYDPSYGFVYVG